MPHQCIECSRTFADGSKQMLAGCPDCGGNKFQFRPKGSVSVDESSSESEPSKQKRPATPQQSTKTASRGKTRTTTLKEWAKKKVTPGSSTAEAPSASATATSTSATASATQSRSESADTVVDRSTATDLDSFDGESAELAHPDERAGEQPGERLDDAETLDDSDREDSAQADARGGFVGEDELPDPPAREEPQQSEDSEPRPDLAQLREELNDQFESIKVVEPGQYELNLMELYDRDEYIIALQENGRYVIEVPDAWDATE